MFVPEKTKNPFNMKRYVIDGNKCLVYMHNQIFDVFVFRSKAEAENYKEKELMKELRWVLPY